MTDVQFIEKEMKEWPTHWYGKSPRAKREGLATVQHLGELCQLARGEVLSEHAIEEHQRALWIIGFELSRDYLLDAMLPSLPVRQRLKAIIEDGGPLLFGYYTRDDQRRFEECCETFERVLRRAGIWDQMANLGRAH